MRRMFDSVSQKYTLLNKILTLGQDDRWRDKLIQSIHPKYGDKILDVCTGTGDLAIKLAKKFVDVEIYAIDFSPNMINEAEKKAYKDGIRTINFIENDCLDIDFEDNSFDYVTISFGFRNLSYSEENINRALTEIYRVLKYNGHLAILETSQPKNRLIRKVFHIYVKKIVPTLGSLISGNGKAYSYLGRSIARFFDRNELEAILVSKGFKKEKIISFMFGGILLSLFKKSTNGA
ncbi:MAG: bifunctional demethylmenaquinone methyltransferase/2-methoxy-6-polyprenyl-1,4-benzoquinol methylase UbiE [Candidatus Poribacteria bacterium]